MTCDPELVEAFAYGELSPARAAEVSAHVASCPSCAAELSWLRAERAAFVSARDVAPLPDVSLILASSREAPPPSRRAFRRVFAGASVVMAGIAACFALVSVLAHPTVGRLGAKPTTAPILACYEGDSPESEEAAYSLRDAIAAVELDYEACLVVTPSAPARRSSRRDDSSVTQALFTPLPLEACQ